MQKIAYIIFAVHLSLTSCQHRWDIVRIGEIHFDGSSEVLDRVINTNCKGTVIGLSIVFQHPTDINDIRGNMRVINQKNGFDKSFVFEPRIGNWTGKKNEIVLVTGAEIPPNELAFHLSFSSSINTNKCDIYVIEIHK